MVASYNLPGRTSTVEILVEIGARVNLLSPFQSVIDTPLMASSRYGYIDIVRVFLLHHSLKADLLDIDETSTRSMDSTALYLACWKGYSEIVSLVLEAGANGNHGCAIDRRLYTPHDC